MQYLFLLILLIVSNVCISAEYEMTAEENKIFTVEFNYNYSIQDYIKPIRVDLNTKKPSTINGPEDRLVSHLVSMYSIDYDGFFEGWDPKSRASMKKRYDEGGMTREKREKSMEGFTKGRYFEITSRIETGRWTILIYEPKSLSDAADSSSWGTMVLKEFNDVWYLTQEPYNDKMLQHFDREKDKVVLNLR